jgi:hypothetical protein
MPRLIPWWLSGLLMALLFYYTFSIWGANRPIGASTGMSYLAFLLPNKEYEDPADIHEINNNIIGA